jgi:hypothetical protein
MDTYSEWAHMRGLFYRWLVTGKFKTRNPIYLLFISIYAANNVSPVFLFFAGAAGQKVFVDNWVFFLPNTLLGILLLINVLISIIWYQKGKSITGD